MPKSTSENKGPDFAQIIEIYLGNCRFLGKPVYVVYEMLCQYDPAKNEYTFYNDEEFAHKVLDDCPCGSGENSSFYRNLVREIRLRAPRLAAGAHPQLGFWGRIQCDASYMVSFPNGIFDARRYLNGHKKCFFRPTPRVFARRARAFNYDPSASCPLWLKTLSEWVSEDAISTLQEWCGLCSVFDMRYQKLLFLRGPKRTGKSTFTAVLTELVGAYNTSNVGLEQLGGEFSREELVGKHLNISPDIEIRQHVPEGVIKSIVAGDRMSRNRKFKKAISLADTVRLVLVANQWPKFTDRSEALLDRMLVVLFENQRAAEDRDLDLTEALLRELPGIFNWGMEGLLRLTRRRYFLMTETMQKELGQLRVEINSARQFLEEWIEEAEGAWIQSQRLYYYYETWAEKQGLPKSSIFEHAEFGKEIRRVFPGVERKRETGEGRPWIYYGIRSLIDHAKLISIGNGEDF